MKKLRGANQLIFACAVSLLLLLPACSSEDLTPIGFNNPSEAEVEALSFNLINRDRRENGLPELVFDAQIANVARAHSTDMRDRDYYGHSDPQGHNFDDRLNQAGVSFAISGENLALVSNMGDPASAANSEFLNHESHRENLLNPRFTRGGVGVARSGGKYWITQNFIGS